MDENAPDPDRFRRLPEPIRLNQTVALHDVSPVGIAALGGAGLFLAPGGGCGDGD